MPLCVARVCREGRFRFGAKGATREPELRTQDGEREAECRIGSGLAEERLPAARALLGKHRHTANATQVAS